jgi:hypothetical protein
VVAGVVTGVVEQRWGLPMCLLTSPEVRVVVVAEDTVADHWGFHLRPRNPGEVVEGEVGADVEVGRGRTTIDRQPHLWMFHSVPS